MSQVGVETPEDETRRRGNGETLNVPIPLRYNTHPLLPGELNDESIFSYFYHPVFNNAPKLDSTVTYVHSDGLYGPHFIIASDASQPLQQKKLQLMGDNDVEEDDNNH